MLDVALQDVGDRFDAAMGVPGKTLDILIGIVVSEIVEQQERVEERDLAVSEDPSEMDPCPLDRGPAFEYLPDLSVFWHERISFIRKGKKFSRRGAEFAEKALKIFWVDTEIKRF
jgi:hypothetical protein